MVPFYYIYLLIISLCYIICCHCCYFVHYCCYFMPLHNEDETILAVNHVHWSINNISKVDISYNCYTFRIVRSPQTHAVRDQTQSMYKRTHERIIKEIFHLIKVFCEITSQKFTQKASFKKVSERLLKSVTMKVQEIMRFLLNLCAD